LASGQFELKNGNLFVLAEAAGGVYNGSQLRLICEVADDVSVFLKVTEDQRIGFMVPKDKLLELHGKLSKSGILLKHYRNHSILSPKACLGELCPKCEQDALGDAIEISPILNEKFKDSFTALTIGMNGCAIACVASATDDIHIVGDNKGYNIFVGGRTSGEPKLAEFVAQGVSKPKIGDAIAIILEAYSQNKQEGESVSDLVSRIGISPFKDAIEKEGLSSAVSQEVHEEELPLEVSDDSPQEGALADDVEEDVAAEPIEETPLEGNAAKASPAADDVEEDVAAEPLEETPLEVSGAKETAPAEEAPLEAVGVEEEPLSEEIAPAEEAPLEAVGVEEVPLSEETAPAEEAPLEAVGVEEVPLSEETAPAEEAPVEEAPIENGSQIKESGELTPSDESTESLAAPAEEAQTTDSTSTGEGSMQEELSVDEPISEATSEGTVTSNTETPEKENEAKGSVSDIKDLNIVDDTAETSGVSETGGNEDPPAPEPIDHGLGEEPTLTRSSESSPGLDENAVPAQISKNTNKTSIQVRGSNVTILLSDGSDFKIPFKTIEEGKTIEMQIENETFIIEKVEGKLQVKYGDFEMHVPLSHGSVLADE
jgi:dissimilatory sulfite reductase (desulfoviridin) alpha/beta subunit